MEIHERRSTGVKCQRTAADSSGGPVVVVTALYDAARLSANGATIVPVGIPGYDTDIDEGTEANGLVEKITAACESNMKDSGSCQTNRELRCTSTRWISSQRIKVRVSP